MPNKTADLNRQRLAAQALSGASGLAAFEDAQRDMTASRNQATSAALDRARNPHTLVTGAQQREIEGIVGGAYDPAMTSASQGHTTMNRHAGSAGAAQAAYAASVGQHGSRASMMRSQEAANRQAQEAAAVEAMRYGGYQTAGEYENAARGGGEMLAAAMTEDRLPGLVESTNRLGSASEANRYLRQLAGQAEAGAAARAEQRADAEFNRRQASARQARAYMRSLESRIMEREGLEPRHMRDVAPFGESMIPTPERPSFPTPSGDPLRQQGAALVRSQSRDAQARQAEIAAINSPQNLASLTRQFATDYLLGDPLDAMGRFPDLTEQQIMQNAVDMAELAARFEDVMNYGPGGEAAAINADIEQMTGGMDASSLASSLGLTEATVAAVASTDMFQQALEAAFPQPTDSLDDAYARAAQVIRSVPAQDAVVAALITEIIDAQMPGFRTAFREEGTASAYDAFSRVRAADTLR